MAHRGDTGFHRGKRMLLCVSVKLICAFFGHRITHFSHFSLFLLFGIMEIYPQIVYSLPKFLNLENMTCNHSFSELISHTTKVSSFTSWPAFCRSILKSKADKWIGKAFMPFTTLCRLRCLRRNSGILVYQLRLPVFQS